MLSAILPAMVGTLFFFKNGNIEPGDAFRLNMSIEGIVMVMLGGYGTVLGPVLGAAAYTGLRGLSADQPVFKDLQLAVAGLLLLLIVLFVPIGLRRLAAPRAARSGEGAAMTLLEVQNLTKRFGGLSPCNRRQLQHRGGRDPGPDRPERRRQDHAVQLRQRGLPAGPGPDRLRRAGRDRQAALRAGAAGRGPRPPDGAAAQRAERAGERDRGRLLRAGDICRCARRGRVAAEVLAFVRLDHKNAADRRAS